MAHPARTPEELREHIAARLTPSGACLIWPGASFKNGYGLIRYGGKYHFVHRLYWSLTVGEIPDGMFIDHICHNKLCANLEHLRVVTPKQNSENRPGAQPNSKTGVRNVIQRRGGYTVSVCHYGKKHYGGYFKTLQEADAAATALRQQLFTHSN